MTTDFPNRNADEDEPGRGFFGAMVLDMAGTLLYYVPPFFLAILGVAFPKTADALIMWYFCTVKEPK